LYGHIYMGATESRDTQATSLDDWTYAAAVKLAKYIRRIFNSFELKVKESAVRDQNLIELVNFWDQRLRPSPIYLG
jgi:hypothetical protein